MQIICIQYELIFCVVSYGLLLHSLERVEDAKNAFVQSITQYPLNWSAWRALANYCPDQQAVRIEYSVCLFGLLFVVIQFILFMSCQLRELEMRLPYSNPASPFHWIRCAFSSSIRQELQVSDEDMDESSSSSANPSGTPNHMQTLQQIFPNVYCC